MHCLNVGSQRVLVFLAWLLLCGVPMRAQDAATVCTVTSGADEGTGTLRQLVASPDCDIIDFHPFIAEIQLERAVEISRKVTIAGPGADLLTIRAGPTGISHFVFGVFPPHSVAISGITLTGGTGGRLGDGGAINTFGALTLERVIIT